MGYKKSKNKAKKILVASATSALAVCAVIGAVLTSDEKGDSKDETAKYADLNETTQSSEKRFNDKVIDSINGDDKKTAEEEKNTTNNNMNSEADLQKNNQKNNENDNENSKGNSSENNSLNSNSNSNQNNDQNNLQAENNTSAQASDGNKINNEEVVQPAAVLPESSEIKKQVIWPVEGNILIDYDMENLVYFKTIDKYKCSDAICIQAEIGTPVYSGADGTIIEIDECAEYGKYMTVDIGDGYTITYGQLDNIPVSSGLTIRKGDLIGYVGKATRFYALEGDNLYVKMTKNGELVDPTDFLDYE